MTVARPWTGEDLDALRVEVGACIAAPIDREAAERDFGRLVLGSVAAVLTPRSAEEVERIVAFANRRALKLTPRGRGMSQGGQSVPAGGVCLDLSRLVDLDRPDGATRTMRCGAGTTWRDAVAMAAPAGLLPKVVPLNLDLTVGGLLSVAGVGATSHEHGPAVACVAEVEVVTGGGARVVCSRDRDAKVHDAVVAGLGRAGIITSARIELRPFRPRVRTLFLLYDDLDVWLRDQRALVDAGRADYLEGFCTPCVQGLRQGPRGRSPFAQWFYALHVTVEHDGLAPDDGDLLGGLGPFRLVHAEDGDTVAYAARYDARFSAMRRSGAWLQPHPWIEAMLPRESIGAILRSILEIYPVALGDGPRLLFVKRRGPPLLVMPEGPDVGCCAILPVAVPAHVLPETLDAFRAIHARIVEQGGKRVLSGWITMMGEDALRDHYGPQCAALDSVKRELDPAGVLDSPLTHPG